MPTKRMHPARIAELGLSGKIGSPHYFHGGMRKFFKIRGEGFVDLIMVQLGQGVRVDILAFDAWLHEQHGEYEDERGLSMKELIAKEYGEQAELFIQSLI